MRTECKAGSIGVSKTEHLRNVFYATVHFPLSGLYFSRILACKDLGTKAVVDPVVVEWQ